MTPEEITARLDEIEEGFGYYYRKPLLAALRAIVMVCTEQDERARQVSADTSDSYNEGWVDGVYEVTTAIEAALAENLARP